MLKHLNTFQNEMNQIEFEGKAVLGWGKPEGTEGYWKIKLDEIIKQVNSDDYREVQDVSRITKVGGYMDGKVSRCRQYVKGINQDVLLINTDDPEIRNFVAHIRKQCQKILRNKHRKEGL